MPWRSRLFATEASTDWGPPPHVGAALSIRYKIQSRSSLDTARVARTKKKRVTPSPWRWGGGALGVSTWTPLSVLGGPCFVFHNFTPFTRV